jgi:transketolase
VYVLGDASNSKPDVLLIATGSEVFLCMAAQAELAQRGVHARVISMPSWKLFEDQYDAYRESVIPSAIRARVSVEQTARFSWERYVGLDGERIGMRTFGESAPLQKLMTRFGLIAARFAKCETCFKIDRDYSAAHSLLRLKSSRNKFGIYRRGVEAALDHVNKAKIAA